MQDIKWDEYAVHPLADKFPIMPDDELKELADAISQNGLRDPILLGTDGKTIIDGRNRYQACKLAGVEPEFEEIDPDLDEEGIADLIVDKNILRRHFTVGQKSFFAIEIKKHKAEIAKLRFGGADPDTCPEWGQARDLAGAVVGVSGRSVSRAEFVDKNAPDLATAVVSGRVPLNVAYTQAKERKRRKQPPSAKTRPAKTAPKQDFSAAEAKWDDNKPIKVAPLQRRPSQYMERAAAAVSGVSGTRLGDGLLRLWDNARATIESDNQQHAFLRLMDSIAEMAALIKEVQR